MRRSRITALTALAAATALALTGGSSSKSGSGDAAGDKAAGANAATKAVVNVSDKKGGTVPREYRDNRYVVSDWHSEHLREPPRGYHWVRSDNGDFLLVAISTGVITDLMLSH